MNKSGWAKAPHHCSKSGKSRAIGRERCRVLRPAAVDVAGVEVEVLRREVRDPLVIGGDRNLALIVHEILLERDVGIGREIRPELGIAALALQHGLFAIDERNGGAPRRNRTVAGVVPHE